MAIDLVTNRHKKIQNMSIDDMAEYFGKNLHTCPAVEIGCSMCKSCVQCWKEFLQGDDTE